MSHRNLSRVVGVVAGLAIIIGYVSTTWIAALGFALLVASATSLVNALKARGVGSVDMAADEEQVE